jgi:hypothetical protein
VDADQAHLEVIGERHQGVGQLRVTMLRYEPLDGIALASPAASQTIASVGPRTSERIIELSRGMESFPEDDALFFDRDWRASYGLERLVCLPATNLA